MLLSKESVYLDKKTEGRTLNPPLVLRLSEKGPCIRKKENSESVSWKPEGGAIPRTGNTEVLHSSERMKRKEGYAAQ